MKYWLGVFATAWRETLAEARLDRTYRIAAFLSVPLVIGAGRLINHSWASAPIIGFVYSLGLVCVTFIVKAALIPPRLARSTSEALRTAVTERDALLDTAAAERRREATDRFWKFHSQRFVNQRTVVREPYFVITVAAVDAVPVADTLIDRILALCVPDGFSESVEGLDGAAWWVFDPKICHEPFKNGESRWCTQVFDEGVFDHVQVITAVDGVADAQHVIERIRGIANRLSAASKIAGFGSDAVVGVTLYGVAHVALKHSGGVTRTFEQPHVTLDHTYITGLGGDLRDGLKPLVDRLWRSAGWRDRTSSAT